MSASKKDKVDDSFDDIFDSLDSPTGGEVGTTFEADDIFSFEDAHDDALLQFVDDAMEAEASTVFYFF